MSKTKKANNAGGAIVCDKCGCEFPVSAVNIKLSGLSINDVYLEAAYFRCPDCNKSYLIQIMDEKCARLREEFVKQKARVLANVGRNNDTETSSAQYTSMLVKQRRFSDRLKTLFDRYGKEIGACLDNVENKVSGK